MKRIVALLLAMTMGATIMFTGAFEARAENESRSEDVDISYILTESALIGYADIQTKGVYLSSGSSVINDAGNSKIGCGGITNAARRCKVSVNAIVEKKVNGSWERVISWTVTNQNALTAIASKTISVGRGYWYRVRCYHYASTDFSSSGTNSLWM